MDKLEWIEGSPALRTYIRVLSLEVSGRSRLEKLMQCDELGAAPIRSRQAIL